MTADSAIPADAADQPARLSKVLAQRGIASRSEADRMIAKGWVRLNGRVAAPGDRALPSDVIELSDEAQTQLDEALTVLVNKPRGFTSAADEFGGAPPMSLLTPRNCITTAPRAPDGLQVPALPANGLRVAGRLSVREMGLVVFTTDTALARRLAADAVQEVWRIDFRSAPPPDAAAVLTNAAALLQAALPAQTLIEPDPDFASALRITAPSLGKGALSTLCEQQGWRADITRLQRGEISLGDLPAGCWRLLR